MFICNPVGSSSLCNENNFIRFLIDVQDFNHIPKWNTLTTYEHKILKALLLWHNNTSIKTIKVSFIDRTVISMFTLASAL